MNAISRPTILEPGIYDMPEDAYHQDPCDTPSLSAGMINDILIAPAKCRENSRRLNPDWEPPEKQDKFTIGTVSHLMFLEPHLIADRVVIVHADDWKKKDSQIQRDEARAEGKTPILAKHMDQVRAARAAFLANSFARRAFEIGRFEQSMFWRRPSGIWGRARPDFIPDNAAHLCDYKATGNADPREFGRHAFNMGYHRRAAWYLDGFRELGADPQHYWFINQEPKSPYLVSVVELDEASIEAGRDQNRQADELFCRCLDRGEWPGYRHPTQPDTDVSFRVGLPNWAHMQIDERTF